MNKIFALLLLTAFPPLVMAENLSLTPPMTDISVIFLANLFGIVDGVLSGTGSQIMGSMFGVFNAAVLALGGIIIMYTVLVGTMNTAQDGQALGEKWSTIWIPMRSTIGLALLMPKASGYCLMQIFVMWVIVQGVGAADLVWNAALGYLNRGGVIVQQQQSPIASITGNSSEVAKAGLKILTSQVCMEGIHSYLVKMRNKNMELKSNKAGPCYQAQQQNDTQSVIGQFCENDVPDFLSSVNAVATQTASDQAAYSLDMPKLDTVPYSNLNGICGTLHWNKFTLSNETAKKTTQSRDPSRPWMVVTQTEEAHTAEGLMGADGDMETVALSRALAIQQMYSDLATVAQRIIGNSPDLGASENCPGFVATGTAGETQDCYSKIATSQFGVPYLANTNTPCTNPDPNCQRWGSAASDAKSTPIFAGTEFQSAVADYNGVMLPSLNLNAQLGNYDDAKKARKFIAEAQAKGWILAGSYFYNLVKLNGSATSGNKNTGANLTDSGTGLGDTTSPKSLESCIDSSTSVCLTSGAADVCTLCRMSASSISYSSTGVPTLYSLGNANALHYLQAIESLIDGSGLDGSGTVNPPEFKSTSVATSGIGSSTVNGFVNNSAMISVPGQPGTSAPAFKMTLNIRFSPGPLYLKAKSFDCGKWKFFNSVCVGRALGNLFYNDIIRYILNFFLDTIVQLLNTIVLIFLALPLEIIAVVFQFGMQQIQQEGSNPILSLAMMGTAYINTSMEMWLYIIDAALITALVPVLGVVIFALIMLAFPLLIAWMGVMTSIGFATAYYVPFVPYMNFLFGSIAWFTVVIEAMVAAPLIALGVTNPEGHEAFGKGESSIMILLNVFLRPALMVIGFISAISLSYVSVWLINEGFYNALQFMGGAATDGGMNLSSNYNDVSTTTLQNQAAGSDSASAENYREGQSGYYNWAGIYAFFFASLMYTSLYMIVVQNAFNLIYQLPDKVLRWIGGAAENTGQEAAGWKEEAKGKIDTAGKATEGAGGSIQKQLSGHAQSAIKSTTEAVSSGSKVMGQGISSSSQ